MKLQNVVIPAASLAVLIISNLAIGEELVCRGNFILRPHLSNEEFPIAAEKARKCRQYQEICLKGNSGHSELQCRQMIDDPEYRAILDSKIAAEDMKKDTDNRARQAALDRTAKLPGVRIGMSKNTVINKTHWGEPDSVNRTTTASGVSEQWVYGGGNYLYFTNGRLTAIQN